MKLYTAPRAPNPRRVDIFLAEKGIEVERENVDLAALAHRSEAFTAINPDQRLPVLELDDGSHISESVAICRYFEEEVQAEPVLFGVGARERVMVEMWQRRIEHELFLPVAMVFRHLHPAMAALEVPQVAAWGEANKPRVAAALERFDRALAGRRFVVGDRYTIADITLLVALDFMKPGRLAVPEGLAELTRWRAEVSSRPSARA